MTEINSRNSIQSINLSLTFILT